MAVKHYTRNELLQHERSRGSTRQVLADDEWYFYRRDERQRSWDSIAVYKRADGGWYLVRETHNARVPPREAGGLA